MRKSLRWDSDGRVDEVEQLPGLLPRLLDLRLARLVLRGCFLRLHGGNEVS